MRFQHARIVRRFIDDVLVRLYTSLKSCRRIVVKPGGVHFVSPLDMMHQDLKMDQDQAIVQRVKLKRVAGLDERCSALQGVGIHHSNDYYDR